MTYPFAHLLARFNGAFGTSTGAEKWSCGIRLGIVGADTPYLSAALQALAEALHAAAITFHSTTNVGTGTTCYFTGVSLARVGNDGKYNPVDQTTVFSTGAAQAGVGNGTHPWNTAAVFSLRTSNPRGLASNGRVYWPALSLAIDPTTGRITSGPLTSRLTAFKTFVNAINTAADTYQVNTGVVVASNVGSGDMKRVNGVRVDQRLDSIERRENSAPAVWQTTTIP